MVDTVFVVPSLIPEKSVVALPYRVVLGLGVYSIPNPMLNTDAISKVMGVAWTCPSDWPVNGSVGSMSKRPTGAYYSALKCSCKSVTQEVVRTHWGDLLHLTSEVLIFNSENHPALSEQT